jgi:hypothetical protein
MTRSFPRRLQRLETWLTHQNLVRRLDKQGRSPAEIIRKRRRVRLAAQGRLSELGPRQNTLVAAGDSPPTLGEIIRLGRRRKARLI